MLRLSSNYLLIKKGVGSHKEPGRDSEPNVSGAKRADGQLVLAGNILYLSERNSHSSRRKCRYRQRRYSVCSQRW